MSSSTAATCLPGGQPSVSIRKSIAWPPSPAFEDSSILVLSSRPHITNTTTDADDALPFLVYLDLRLSIATASKSPQMTWAFAGVRKTLKKDRDDDDPRYRWERVIDSRKVLGDEMDVDVHLDGSELLADEGAVKVVKDDNGEEIEVETGVGWDPELKINAAYEEIWRLGL